MKKLVIECLVLKQRTVSECLEYLRRNLLKALKNGMRLVISLSDSAPDFLKTFTSPQYFPIDIFRLGGGYKWFDSLLFYEDERFEKIHDEFILIVSSNFNVIDYNSMLSLSLPLNDFKVVSVNEASLRSAYRM